MSGRGGLVGLDEVAAAARWAGHGRAYGGPTPRARRMLRYLRAAERRLGVCLLHRTGVGPGCPYQARLAIVRQHCPELFEMPITEVQRRVSGALVGLDHRIAEAARAVITSDVDPRIDELHREDLRLADAIVALAKRIPVHPPAS